MKQLLKMVFMIVAITLLCLGILGCKSWEYDVERNGIQFKKFHQDEDGFIIGNMSHNQNIHGFPCEKGWIHFKDDWSLQSFQLSEDFLFKGHLFPAHTWIHMPYHRNQDSFIVALPHDCKLQGHVCGGSGGFKGTQTSIYMSGRLRSFFPPEDIVIQGVSCKATLFENVCLYENGNLKSTKLAADYTVDGKTWKKGSFIEFDPFGNVAQEQPN